MFSVCFVISLYPLWACNFVLAHRPINGTGRVRSCYLLTITSWSLCFVIYPDDECCHDVYPEAVGCYVGDLLLSLCVSALCLSAVTERFSWFAWTSNWTWGGTIHPQPFLIKLLVLMTSPSPSWADIFSCRIPCLGISLSTRCDYLIHR